MAHAHVKAGSRPANSLGEIRRAGEGARDLVDQILTFGRRGAMRRERICVKELIAETRTLLEASLPHHISLMIHETSETTVVAAEPAQLQQVILNVCNNVNRYPPRSGSWARAARPISCRRKTARTRASNSLRLNGLAM
jgi:signal transduction histidine kinase